MRYLRIFLGVLSPPDHYYVPPSTLSVPQMFGNFKNILVKSLISSHIQLF